MPPPGVKRSPGKKARLDDRVRRQSFMKSPAPKILILLVSLVASVLVVGVFIVARHPAWLRPKVQARRYQHQHLPSSEWEAGAKLPAASYTLREGETLAGVATLRYGHRYYYRIIKLYNHIENEELVKAGTTLRLPDISNILAEEGFTRVAGPEAEMILCSRAKYDRVVRQLWELRIHADANYALPAGVRQELLEAADDLEQATQRLKESRPGVIRAPESMIGQLEQSMEGMRALAEGAHEDPNGYDIDIVQQRYALALTYAIIWVRKEFR